MFKKTLTLCTIMVGAAYGGDLQAQSARINFNKSSVVTGQDAQQSSHSNARAGNGESFSHGFGSNQESTQNDAVVQSGGTIGGIDGASGLGAGPLERDSNAVQAGGTQSEIGINAQSAIGGDNGPQDNKLGGEAGNNKSGSGAATGNDNASGKGNKNNEMFGGNANTNDAGSNKNASEDVDNGYSNNEQDKNDSSKQGSNQNDNNRDDSGNSKPDNDGEKPNPDDSNDNTAQPHPDDAGGSTKHDKTGSGKLKQRGYVNPDHAMGGSKASRTGTRTLNAPGYVHPDHVMGDKTMFDHTAGDGSGAIDPNHAGKISASGNVGAGGKLKGAGFNKGNLVGKGLGDPAGAK